VSRPSPAPAPPPDELHIQYVPLDKVAEWDENPKKHDLLKIAASIREHGFRDAPIFDATLQALVAGHGRCKALKHLRDAGNLPPRGIKAGNDGDWYVPVQFGVDAMSAAAAKAFAIDHNNLTLGPEFGVFETARLWDDEGYKAVLLELNEVEILPVTVDIEDFRVLTEGLTLPDVPPEREATPAATITIRVENLEAKDQVSQAIGQLLGDHPEWNARVTR
jgi:hypothetical protein